MKLWFSNALTFLIHRVTAFNDYALHAITDYASSSEHSLRRTGLAAKDEEYQGLAVRAHAGLAVPADAPCGA